MLPELSKLKLKANISVRDHHDHDNRQALGQKRPLDEYSSSNVENGPSTRAVSLGSRKQLCINDELRHRALDLDEACRELLGGL